MAPYLFLFFYKQITFCKIVPIKFLGGFEEHIKEMLGWFLGKIFELIERAILGYVGTTTDLIFYCLELFLFSTFGEHLKVFHGIYSSIFP